MPWRRTCLALALVCLVPAGCQPLGPELTTEQASTSSDASTAAPTGDSSGASTVSGSSTGGCSDPLWHPLPDQEVIAQACESLTDMTTCEGAMIGGARCEWLTSRLFPGCDAAPCETALSAERCVAVARAETGCTIEATGFWRRSPAGLHVIREKYCFELPVGWIQCEVSPRTECACGP